MKERTIVKGLVVLLVSAFVLATRETDVIYLVSGILFFALCIAYAEWCERL